LEEEEEEDASQLVDVDYSVEISDISSKLFP